MFKRNFAKLVKTFLSNCFNHIHFFQFILIFYFSGLLFGQSTPSALSVVVSGSNLSYQWYSNTVNSTVNATVINLATYESYIPPATPGTMYYFAVVQGACGSEVTSAVVSVEISDNYMWNGTESSDWNTASNWSPNGIPSITSQIYIPNCPHSPLKSSLTIACGGSVTLASGSNLTIDGAITNNGILTVETGATLVQTGLGNNTGSGSSKVKQMITGSGGSTPNGRFWYLGTPMQISVSADYKAETSTVLKFFNEPTCAWEEINDATTPIQVGQGYFVQSGTIDTIEFSGGQLNNGDYYFPCTRTGSVNSYRGFNLVSNPYVSYLDFNQAIKTNILPTMWYRTADQSGGMVFDTYNSMTGIGTSVGNVEAVTSLIPPMQSFWVKIPAGYTTGEIGFANEMRSHHSLGFEGLRNTKNDFPIFLRMNLIDQEKKDQFIVVMDDHLNSLVDEFDSEKMNIVGYPQIYSSVGNTKLVINALPLSKLKTIVPISVNLPSSKFYQFQFDEVHLDNASIILEDKQENIFQDISIDSCYSFYSNLGMINDRFFLHFNSFIGLTASAYIHPDNVIEESGVLAPVITQYGLGGDVHIKFEEVNPTEYYLKIFDMSGELIYLTTIRESETTVQLLEANGLYFLELNDGHRVFRKKIVIAN
ncbi:MAG: RemA [Bacteroidota bacterium]|jgi:hypothetical protein